MSWFYIDFSYAGFWVVCIGFEWDFVEFSMFMNASVFRFESNVCASRIFLEEWEKSLIKEVCAVPEKYAAIYSFAVVYDIYFFTDEVAMLLATKR